MKLSNTVITAVLIGLLLSACSRSPVPSAALQPPVTGGVGDLPDDAPIISPTTQTNEVNEAKVSAFGLTRRETCQQAGGRWQTSGILRIYGCLLPAKDAGKICTDDSQCQYNCNARSGEKPEPGQPATGQCQANNTYTGCYIEIRDGRARPEFCMSF